MLCIYHIADHDGKGSAAIVKSKFPETELMGLNHDMDIPYDEIEKHDKIVICDKTDYLFFIEDCFAYIEKYRYASGMEKLVSMMTVLLSDDFGTQNDRALLLNNQASCEGLLNSNYRKAIELEKRAINMCEPTSNPLLAANLHMNLGYLYQANSQLALAKQSMENAMQICRLSRLM